LRGRDRDLCRGYVSLVRDVRRQQRAQVCYVRGGQPQRVQLGQFGVGRHPRQCRLESAERLAEHTHPSPLPSVGRVPRTTVLQQVPLLLLMLLFQPPVWPASAHVTSATTNNDRVHYCNVMTLIDDE